MQTNGVVGFILQCSFPSLCKGWQSTRGVGIYWALPPDPGANLGSVFCSVGSWHNVHIASHWSLKSEIPIEICMHRLANGCLAHNDLIMVWYIYALGVRRGLGPSFVGQHYQHVRSSLMQFVLIYSTSEKCHKGPVVIAPALCFLTCVVDV